MMCKYLKFFTLLTALTWTMSAAHTAQRAADYVAPHTYNNMYPYMTNSMRTNLTNGNATNQNTAQINVLTRTIGTDSRRVVPRRTTNTARTATVATQPTMRIAMGTPTQANTNRRVVARATRQNAVTDTASRAGTTNSVATNNTTTAISSARCLADYTACMDGYCQREKTAYNRCYCSAKLAQIDSKYQSELDGLIMELISLQGTKNWTDAEMNEYWMDTVGKYSGENSWTNLDNALNINWADTESRIRGQNAFNTGHEYCVQHLQGCFYMAANLRDAYRSEIARDCASYEEQLQRLKNAAESIVESYK